MDALSTKVDEIHTRVEAVKACQTNLEDTIHTYQCLDGRLQFIDLIIKQMNVCKDWVAQDKVIKSAADLYGSKNNSQYTDMTKIPSLLFSWNE